ncbi:peptidase T [Erysipelothrix larvae]|uniref:Peptidase T n=1 Tax=Erysipelothrix larvae TaxID=1514105 RepID=A0A0X8GZ40_9FIRM|nr:peptidase T [Erysipelothrix larvae]AMC93071.1 peptidase T [Erysipelothrix larvae]
MKNVLIERLIRYCKVHTRSDSESTTVPSTKIQFDLAHILVDECKAIGLEDVTMDKTGIVYATLPSNIEEDVPTIGFIAHMDTADFKGDDVKPRIIENYDGKDIVLNEALGIVTAVDVFPNLKDYVGKTLIVTDGTTLLGADDKAGIANIMTAMEFLIQHPEIKHGKVRVAFTIDEEIGTGADSFDVEGFGAQFAYTVDGSRAGEMEYETFNAAGARITFTGVSVHPGTAKDTMVHAAILINEFINQLPEKDRPEHTERYEGFFMITDMASTIENGRVDMIIRDHDKASFEARKKRLIDIQDAMNAKYGATRVSVDLKDQYYNMRDVLEENMHVVDLARTAIENIGLTPIVEPVRGGTDGSRLSYMGLPTPNLFTGGENFHGKHELAVVESMEQSTQTILEIIRLNACKQGE